MGGSRSVVLRAAAGEEGPAMSHHQNCTLLGDGGFLLNRGWEAGEELEVLRLVPQKLLKLSGCWTVEARGAFAPQLV